MGVLSEISRIYKSKYFLGVLILGTSLLLVGCSGLAESDDPQITSSEQSDLPSDSDQSSPPPTQSNTPVGEKVSITCVDIFSPQSLYEMNPNLAEVKEYISGTNTTGSTLRGIEGISCNYVNLSGGAATEVSVAKLSTESVKHVQEALSASGNSTPLNLEGVSCSVYFSIDSERGLTQALCGQTWVAIDSEETSTANDSYPYLIPAILAATK